MTVSICFLLLLIRSLQIVQHAKLEVHERVKLPKFDVTWNAGCIYHWSCDRSGQQRKGGSRIDFFFQSGRKVKNFRCLKAWTSEVGNV